MALLLSPIVKEIGSTGNHQGRLKAGSSISSFDNLNLLRSAQDTLLEWQDNNL
jgi:hypothetical protein